jgi:hypothetical protein
MSIDQVMRAFGTVASLYLVAIAISAMTVASIGAAGIASATLCSGRDCSAIVSAHHPVPPESPRTPFHAVLMAPMILLDD